MNELKDVRRMESQVRYLYELHDIDYRMTFGASFEMQCAAYSEARRLPPEKHSPS